MKGAYSISVSQGHIAPAHDRREYTPDNADRRLRENNHVILDTVNMRDEFNKLFEDSISRYNAGQKRKDRRKDFDYLSEIESSTHAEKPFYEYVLQIGNNETNGITTPAFDRKQQERWAKDKDSFDLDAYLNKNPDRSELVQVLDESVSDIQERYPNFHFWAIIGHDDEPCGTYHLHLRFTPIAHGYAQGMDTRCSLTKALNEMGFHNGEGLAISQWQNDLKGHIEEVMIQHGYARDYMSNKERHLSTPMYKLKTEKEELCDDIEKLTLKCEALKSKHELLEESCQNTREVHKKAILENVTLSERNDKLKQENADLSAANEKIRAQKRQNAQERARNERQHELLQKRENELNEALSSLNVVQTVHRYDKIIDEFERMMTFWAEKGKLSPKIVEAKKRDIDNARGGISQVKKAMDTTRELLSKKPDGYEGLDF